MLWNREDAEDATQEILVRAVTRLAQFDFRSALKTWVYRIAVNYILDVKKSPVKRIGRDRFVRNVLYAVGNSGDAALLPAAEALLDDPSAVVRDAAGWAVERLACFETTATRALNGTSC